MRLKLLITIDMGNIQILAQFTNTDFAMHI